MAVSFTLTLAGLLLFGVVVLVVLLVRMRGALRRFGMVRGWLEDYLADRTGLLKARSAALAVGLSDLRQVTIRNTQVGVGPRTIDVTGEREDHRA
jgi:hypothetical protein